MFQNIAAMFLADGGNFKHGSEPGVTKSSEKTTKHQSMMPSETNYLCTNSAPWAVTLTLLFWFEFH